MFPALSLIVMLSVLTVQLKYLLKLPLLHPESLSLQFTEMLLSPPVHDVDAPLTPPHDGAVLSTYTFTPQDTEFPAPSFNVMLDVLFVDENVCDLAPHPLPPESLQFTVIVLLPFVHDVDAPLMLPHVGAFLSTYTLAAQFVVHPALSFIVTLPVFVDDENVFENCDCVQPECESLQFALIVLFPFVHDVDAPLIVPHVGAFLST